MPSSVVSCPLSPRYSSAGTQPSKAPSDRVCGFSVSETHTHERKVTCMFEGGPAAAGCFLPVSVPKLPRNAEAQRRGVRVPRKVGELGRNCSHIPQYAHGLST